MYDVIGLLGTMVNVQAAMIGVVAVQVWNYIAPGAASPEGAFSTKAGGWMARAAPAIAPLFGALACVLLEWDGRIQAYDVSRGILSGFASEFMLRVYYKTIKGL